MRCMGQDEFEMNMRLLGARTIDEIVPDMVDASSLSSHFVQTPQDVLFNNTCGCYRCLPVWMSWTHRRDNRSTTVARQVQGVETVDLSLLIFFLVSSSSFADSTGTASSLLLMYHVQHIGLREITLVLVTSLR